MSGRRSGAEHRRRRAVILARRASPAERFEKADVVGDIGDVSPADVVALGTWRPGSSATARRAGAGADRRRRRRLRPRCSFRCGRGLPGRACGQQFRPISRNVRRAGPGIGRESRPALLPCALHEEIRLGKTRHCPARHDRRQGEKGAPGRAGAAAPPPGLARSQRSRAGPGVPAALSCPRTPAHRAGNTIRFDFTHALRPTGSTSRCAWWRRRGRRTKVSAS